MTTLVVCRHLRPAKRSIRSKGQVNGEGVSLQGVVMSYDSPRQRDNGKTSPAYTHTHIREHDFREDHAGPAGTCYFDASRPKLRKQRMWRTQCPRAGRALKCISVSIRTSCPKSWDANTRKSPDILEERKLPAFVVLWPTHAAAKQ